MSVEMVDATCSAAGVVTADGVTVAAAEVLSEGTKASSGVLLMRGDEFRYVTSNASDIKDLIEALVEIVDKIVTITTAIDAASNSPGGQTSNIALLTALKVQLDQSKETLK